jgi:hypothetical protein
VTSAASNFTDFITWLNSHAQYVILWGYEELPEHIHGGDVDIFIRPIDYEIVVEELHRKGYSSSMCPHYSDKHRHEQLSREGDYTLHLCDSFCFIFQEKVYLLKLHYNYFLRHRIYAGSFWVAEPMTEAFLTALRIIGGRKDCMTRLEKFLEEIK